MQTEHRSALTVSFIAITSLTSLHCIAVRRSRSSCCNPKIVEEAGQTDYARHRCKRVAEEKGAQRAEYDNIAVCVRHLWGISRICSPLCSPFLSRVLEVSGSNDNDLYLTV
jgi:hypothetical protein